MESNNRSNNIQSVIKTFSLIEALSKSPNGLNIKELEIALDMHKSSIYRIISTLIDLGYLNKTIDGYYKLTLKVLGLGNKLLNDINIIDLVKPHLMNISLKTNETCHLVMFENIEAIYLDVIHPKNNSFRSNSFIGKRGPLFATAVGKLYLAFMSEKELENTWKKLEGTLVKFTKNTIVNLEEMKSHIRNVKNNFYAVDDEEHELNVFCIGVPILSHTGEVKHAISVSFPKSKMTQELFDETLNFLQTQSKIISKELGYNK